MKRRISSTVGVAVLLVVLAACGQTAGGRGRLGPGITSPATVTKSHFGTNRPFLFGGFGVCSQHEPVQVVSVEPDHTSGPIKVEQAGLMTVDSATRGTFPLIAAQSGVLPPEYQTPTGFRPPPCTSPSNAQVVLQVRRIGAQTAGVLGVRVTYLDERGARHVQRQPLNYILCGEQPNPTLDKYC